MEIKLINPPSPYLANDAAYPPMGLMYLASSIIRQGHIVEIVDLTGGIDWKTEVLRLEADLSGISCVTPNFNIVAEIADLLPQETPVIIGGVHPTFLPDNTLENISCDAVVMGEGEIVIQELIRDLEQGCLKKIYHGGLIPVDSIPKPARHLLDLHKYKPGGEDATPVYTSRGCPYNCNFCSKTTGRTYRALPISRVIEEIEEVVSMGFRRIVFGDDNIIINPKRVKNLLKAVKPLDIEFRLNQDARYVKDDVVALAADVGCTEISYGIEHGSQKMLDLMNKRTTVEANKKAISATRKHGLIAKAYFIVNFPGETDETIKETLRFAAEMMPDKWLLSAFVPLPGSDTFHNPAKYGIDWMSHNWEDYYLVGKDGSFAPCFTTKELSIERQIYFKDILSEGLKEILG